jgi:hypothetical protein
LFIIAIGRPNYGDTFDKHHSTSESSVIIAGERERKKDNRFN